MLYLVQATQKNQAPPLVVRLRRALLRARIVVEEAEARQVTNRAMLLQLNQLRGEMCRGSYVLDAFMRPAEDHPPACLSCWRVVALARAGRSSPPW
jgi:hypothetical protein